MKRITPWLILGILIRLIIIPITLHPDIRGYNLGAYLISNGHIFNFYDYLGNLPHTDQLISIYGKDLFIYPPLAYLYPAIFVKIFSFIFPNELFQTLLIDMWKTIGHPQFSLLVYLLKAPYLIPDLLIVYLFGKLFKNTKEKFLAQVFWLLNPVVIYATYMISQFDVLLALSIVACLIMAKNRKFFYAAVALALGAAVKQFVFLLLPILAIYTPGSWVKKAGVFLTGLGVYVLMLLPYLSSVGFRRYALMASQTDKIFFAKIPISGAAFLPLFLIGLFFIYWLCMYFKKRYDLWQWFLFPMLLFYSVVHFHPQWFTWVTPLLVISLVRLGKKAVLPVTLMLVAYIGIILMFEPSLNTGIFYPLNPPWDRDYSLIPILTKLFPEFTLRSIFFSLLAASAGAVAFLTYKNPNGSQK